jgi:hypothetical protein
MSAQRVQMKGVLSWLVGWSFPAGTREFLFCLGIHLTLLRASEACSQKHMYVLYLQSDIVIIKYFIITCLARMLRRKQAGRGLASTRGGGRSHWTQVRDGKDSFIGPWDSVRPPESLLRFVGPLTQVRDGRTPLKVI